MCAQFLLHMKNVGEKKKQQKNLTAPYTQQEGSEWKETFCFMTAK